MSILTAMTTSDSKSQKELASAIKELTESLGNRVAGGDKKIVWIDSAHIACKHGNKVFDHEKKAVEHLEKVTDPALQSQVTNVINSIVAADRKLAQTAVDESALTKDREHAIDKLNKGDSRTKPKEKIQEYRKAWKYLNKDCDKAGKVSCIDEISVMSPMGDTVTAIGDEVGTPDTVFTDIYDNQVAIRTACDKCIKVGDLVKGWTITEIFDDGTLALKCAKK